MRRWEWLHFYVFCRQSVDVRAAALRYQGGSEEVDVGGRFSSRARCPTLVWWGGLMNMTEGATLCYCAHMQSRRVWSGCRLDQALRGLYWAVRPNRSRPSCASVLCTTMTMRPGRPEVQNASVPDHLSPKGPKSIRSQKSQAGVFNNDANAGCLCCGVHFEGHYVITLHYACFKLF